MPMKVLHAAAEVFPLVKTGGLADVVGALPAALQAAGAQVRLVLPGLPAIADAVLHQKTVLECGPLFGAMRVAVRLGRLPFSHIQTYVIEAPYLYRRGGSPYQASDGSEWPDNLQRFALLGYVAAHLAAGEIDPKWAPDVLHAHDWHAALACAYMAAHPGTAARSVFTIHNLAYQGLFPHDDFRLLGLPASFMHAQGLEFHHQVSFMKAGLKYARRITTVSPSYAREIATPEFGCGLDGVIRGRGRSVSGILNGVDPAVWNPRTDPALAARYDAQDLGGKVVNKRALQAALGLHVRDDAPLFGAVSRLTAQKGLDLVLAALPALVREGAQLALQGSGDAALEAAFMAAAQSHPGQVAVRIGYDEGLAHRLIAGADVMLVPSRFEPCGLTQLYALRYGTLPLVRHVGGLADTVVDAGAADGAMPEESTPRVSSAPSTLSPPSPTKLTPATPAPARGSATGFVFEAATPAALEAAMQRAIAHYRRDGGAWPRLMRHAMAEDFSWGDAARRYLALYRDLLDGPAR